MQVWVDTEVAGAVGAQSQAQVQAVRVLLLPPEVKRIEISHFIMRRDQISINYIIVHNYCIHSKQRASLGISNSNSTKKIKE